MGNCSSLVDEYGEGWSCRPTLSCIFPTHAANQHHIPTRLKIHNGVRYLVAKSNQQCKSAILFFHGNYVTVDKNTYKTAQTYATHFKKDVYIFEYPGYGESVNDGPATPQSTSKAGKIIFDMLNTQYDGVDLLAQSIGTAVAIRTIALKIIPRKLVLISPLATTTSIVTSDVPLFNAFDSIYLAKNINCPVCIIHGGSDKVIDISHAKKLYDALDIPKELHVIPEAGHNIIFTTVILNIIYTFLVK